MKIVTKRIHPDEPCHSLWEGPKNGRWLQRVFVIRGDTIARWTKDYGPITKWPDATEIFYPSFGENSVAQLQELAERDRHSDKWVKRGRERLAESTLIPDILRQEEQLIHVKANRSNFGPGISVQRNDFPREAANRKLRRKNGR